MYPSGRITECERANMIINLAGAEIIVPRFGSSDCRCPAHLVYFQKRPSLKYIPNKNPEFSPSRFHQ
ncbi:MAG: hypothetical protein HY036_11015 [Nitrospirae bacterium]|nr:hypothetical protein [Nitrospirota bacterium]